MISSLETGAIFKIVDEASPAILKISESLKVLQDEIDAAKASFVELGRGSFASLTGQIDKLAEGMTGVKDVTATATDAMTSGMAKVSGTVDTLAASVKSLGAEMQGLAAKSAEMARAGAAGGGAGGAPPSLRARGTGGHGGSSGLHGRPLHLGGPFGFSGGDIAAAGGLWSAYEALKAAADLQEIQENLKISGVSPAEIAKATQESYSIGAQYGLTATSVLRGINEIRNPLNKGTSADSGVEDALRHAPTLARAAVVLRDQGKDRNGDVGRELYDLTKSAEFRNAISDKDFDKAVGSMVSAAVATGGVVTPRTFLQMSQMLKGALPGLSDDYLYKIMPELSQEFGGARAGTAATSLYQQLIAGQMRTTGIKLLDDLGMVDESKADFDKNGRIVRMRPGAYKDSETFKLDPMKGMADLIEAMKSHGITTEGAQRDELTMLFANRNAAQMAMTLGYQYPRLQRGAQGIENTWPLGSSSDELLKNNPFDQMSKLTSSFTNLGAELGTDLMPAAIDAAHGLTTIAQSLASVFKAFPLLGALAQSGFSLGGKAADAAADIGKHTSLGALWNWITGSGASAADSDKAWADFQKQFKPGDLNNLPDLGPVPDKSSQSWFGDKGSWFHKMSFDGGGMSGGAAMARNINIVANVVNLANAGGAGAGGAGGFMNAAYTQGGALGGGGGLHSGGGYVVRGGDGGNIGASSAELDAMAASGTFPDSPAGRAAFIRANAMKLGIDPNYALSVAKSEGLFGVGPNHQNAQGYNVFGDFQLNYARGVGVAARAAGIEPSDWQRSDLFALNWMKTHGTDDWAASGHHGPVPLYHALSPLSRGGYHMPNVYTNGQSSEYPAPGEHIFSDDYSGSDFSHRSPSMHAAWLNIADTGDAGVPVHNHIDLKINEKTIATAVQRHIVNANRQVMGASKHDSHGHMQLVDQGYQWDR